MGKRNKNKPTVFNPPVRYPNSPMGKLAGQIKKAHHDDIIRETNNTLNLVTSAYSIVLHEFFDFTEEKLKETLLRVMEQLELCADEIVTIDQMMDLCTEYGLEVTKTADKLDEFGTLMLKKTAAFELLDKGVTEVEDIAKQGDMSSRLASAFRWEWNKIKYGKDYEGDVYMASKKELAYKIFDEGIMNDELIAEETNSTVSSVKTYRRDWKKEVLEMLSTEEAAPYFAGEKQLHEIKAEKLAAIQANKKTYVAPTKEEVKANEAVEEVSRVEEVKESAGSSSGEVKRENEQILEAAGSTKKGLKKVVKIVSIEGEFAEYKPSGNNWVNVEINGQVLSFTREELQGIAWEFCEVAADEDIWGGDVKND